MEVEVNCVLELSETQPGDRGFATGCLPIWAEEDDLPEAGTGQEESGRENLRVGRDSTKQTHVTTEDVGIQTIGTALKVNVEGEVTGQGQAEPAGRPHLPGPGHQGDPEDEAAEVGKSLACSYGIATFHLGQTEGERRTMEGSRGTWAMRDGLARRGTRS